MQSPRKFQNAPVTEMTLTVNFGPVFTGLTILDIAHLYDNFRPRYPFFQHLPVAGPMSADLNSQQIFSMDSQASDVPRVMFGAGDLQTSLYFQFDRLTIDWQRRAPLGSPDNYPGFEQMLSLLLDELGLLRQWAKSRGLPDFGPAVGELAYSNAFEMSPDGKKRHLSDIFSFFTNPRQAKMSSFTCGWTERLDIDGFDGHLNAGVQSTILADGKTGVLFNLLGLIDMKDTDWEGGKKLLRQTHEKMFNVFEGSIQQGALQKANP